MWIMNIFWCDLALVYFLSIIYYNFMFYFWHIIDFKFHFIVHIWHLNNYRIQVLIYYYYMSQFLTCYEIVK